jgi:hypothetical protein
MFLLWVPEAPAAVIDNETVTIIDSFTAFPGYDVEYAIDTGDDRYLSDYASQGGRDQTYIEFDFGTPYTFSEIIMTDRVTSGGPNFVWYGGLFDYNTEFRYIFSVDANFTNGNGVSDDVVIDVLPEQPPGRVMEDEIELLQTTTPIPNVRAQYLRWEILATNGANPGANDFQFSASTAGVLEAGDADMDFDFDQLDLVRVQVAGKYLSGQSATWGEGDWDGAPGGAPGNPPPGDRLFNQIDIIAALNAGKYLQGKYNAIQSGGNRGDGQTSIVYNPSTGELAVDAPAGVQLTSVNIDSAGRVFTGAPAMNLGGSFDNDSDNNIFKATFGSSFGSLSFGNVAQPGLSQQFVLNDLTVVGSLAGGGALGNVDLIYVPEPPAIALLGIGLAGTLMVGLQVATQGRRPVG